MLCDSVRTTLFPIYRARLVYKCQIRHTKWTVCVPGEDVGWFWPKVYLIGIFRTRLYGSPKVTHAPCAYRQCRFSCNCVKEALSIYMAFKEAFFLDTDICPRYHSTTPNHFFIAINGCKWMCIKDSKLDWITWKMNVSEECFLFHRWLGSFHY